jgi:hypothetical protein
VIEQQLLLTPLQRGMVNRASLYADDLVIFVAPNVQDLSAIWASLTIFGLASGLFSNLDKGVATPLHCSEVDVARVREILSYRVDTTGIHFFAERRRLCRAFFFGRSAKKALPRAK